MNAPDGPQWTQLLEVLNLRGGIVYVDHMRSGAEPQIKLTPWTETFVGDTLADGLLRLVRFPELFDRGERIKRNLEETFEWIFRPPSASDKPWDSFVGWLESSQDLYWITGKAGSGKSTLMKYIIHDCRVREMLGKWSGKKPLILAAHYFWISGTTMQMSQTGLLQSLIYQMLSQRRDLHKDLPQIPVELLHLFLVKDESRPWLWTELAQALRVLLEEKINGEPAVNYCFFIDGLDEYAGEKSDLIETIAQISVLPNVKICVSSRPWVVFEDAYKQKPSLLMQDLTYPDIKLYITKKFNSSPACVELAEMEKVYYNNLIEDVAAKSSGVFLWVVLVVNSLIQGFSEGDRIKEVEERLEQLPHDLEELFKKILDNLDPKHIGQASQLFQILSASIEPLDLLSLAFADDGVEAAFNRETKQFTPKEKMYKATVMKRRLISRCKGLLEVDEQDEGAEEENGVVDPDQDPAKKNESPDAAETKKVERFAAKKVQYLHRTVKDFLEQPHIWSQLLAATPPPFNPEASLYASYLQRIKTFDTGASATDIQKQRRVYRPAENRKKQRSADQLIELITGALEFTARAEAHIPQAEYIKFIDELDQVIEKSSLGSLLFDAYFESSKHHHHWSCSVPIGKEGSSLFDLAVSCKLIGWVSVKLDERALALEKGVIIAESKFVKDLLPLLFTAVANYDRLGGILRRPNIAHEQPCLEMIELFVKHGANIHAPLPPNSPDHRYDGQTIMNIVRHRAKHDVEWKQIYEMLLKYDVKQPPSELKKQEKSSKWGAGKGLVRDFSSLVRRKKKDG